MSLIILILLISFILWMLIQFHLLESKSTLELVLISIAFMLFAGIFQFIFHDEDLVVIPMFLSIFGFVILLYSMFRKK